MSYSTTTLEETLITKFITPSNEQGLGKIIYNEGSNESLISNGKSLITYANTELIESSNVQSHERTQIVKLANTLIHQNYGVLIACELYFSKDDVKDLLEYMDRYSFDKVELTFNGKLGVVLASAVNNPSLVKILRTEQINAFKATDMTSTIEVEQLYNVLELMHQEMSGDSTLGIALQHNNRPVLIATEQVSACIATIN